MKLIPTPSKIIAYGAALALVSVTAYATSIPAQADWNPATLEATVATQDEKINDHETRLKTVETQTAANTTAITEVKTAIADLPTATPGQALQAVEAVVAGTAPTPTPTRTVTKVTTTGTIGDEVDPPTAHYVFDDGSTLDEPATVSLGRLIGARLRVGDSVPF